MAADHDPLRMTPLTMASPLNPKRYIEVDLWNGSVIKFFGCFPGGHQLIRDFLMSRKDPRLIVFTSHYEDSDYMSMSIAKYKGLDRYGSGMVDDRVEFKSMSLSSFPSVSLGWEIDRLFPLQFSGEDQANRDIQNIVYGGVYEKNNPESKAALDRLLEQNAFPDRRRSEIQREIQEAHARLEQLEAELTEIEIQQPGKYYGKRRSSGLSRKQSSVMRRALKKARSKGYRDYSPSMRKMISSAIRRAK